MPSLPSAFVSHGRHTSAPAPGRVICSRPVLALVAGGVVLTAVGTGLGISGGGSVASAAPAVQVLVNLPHGGGSAAVDDRLINASAPLSLRAAGADRVQVWVDEAPAAAPTLTSPTGPRST
jgi:hypothetical protein